jgi:hypothetical protein
LDGPTFSQTTVLTWMHTAEANSTQLRHTAASLGVQVSNQAIEQRFSEASARLLRAVRVSPEEARRRREGANGRITHPPKGCQAPVPGKRKPKAQRQGKRKGKQVSAARLRLADWTIMLTTVPQELPWVQEALVLLRCRRPIELLWKLWKQHGKLETWRSYKPERLLTEIYAKLLGLVITHWQVLIGCWQAPNRSLLKATQVVQWMTPCLALALTGLVPVPTIVERTALMMQTGCTLTSRRKRPNTHQLLADPRLVRGLG